MHGYLTGHGLDRMVCHVNLAASRYLVWDNYAFRATCFVFYDLGTNAALSTALGCNTILFMASNCLCGHSRDMGCVGVGTLVDSMGVPLGAAGVEPMGATGSASNSCMDRRLRSIFPAGVL